MERPHPKELIIQHDRPTDRTVVITVSSPDARTWIDTEAPLFGSLLNLSGGINLYHWLLYIAPTFDPIEVVAYLRSYSDKESN